MEHSRLSFFSIVSLFYEILLYISKSLAFGHAKDGMSGIVLSTRVERALVE